MKKMKFILLITLFVTSIIPIGCNKSTYVLTVGSEGQGTVVPPVGNYIYEKGKSVTMSAYPVRDWKFDSWAGDSSDTDGRIVVNMDGPKDITAKFSKGTGKLFFLTIAIEGDGKTAPTAGRHAYSEGAVITIASDPGVGSQFDMWSGRVASATSATTVVTMRQNETVTAYFRKKPVLFGPETRNIGTGNGHWDVSLNSEDEIKVNFTVSGADVNYSIIDPAGNIVLSSPTKTKIGQFIFTTETSGNYQITFYSTSKVISSKLTLSYAIYPKP